MKYDFKKPEYMQKAGNKGYNIFVELMIAFVVFMVANIISAPLQSVASIGAMLTDERYIEMLESGETDMELIIEVSSSMPDWVMVVSLVSQIFMIVTCIVYCRFIEKRSIESMGFVKKGAFLQYLIGVGLGIGLFSACYGVCALTGSYTSIVFNEGVSVVMLVLYFIGFMIQGMAEEVFCRGYLMTSIGRRYGVIVSVLVSALVFSLLHGMNAGISVLALINLFLYGVVMSLLMVRFNNIWIVGALHSLWNFVQGNFYGVQVSGTVSDTSVLATTANEELALLNGGSFGLEGGIVCTAMLVIVSALLVVSICRRGGFAKKEMQTAA